MVFSSLCHICRCLILKHFRADVTSHTERELQEPPTFSRTKPSTKQSRTISSPEATTVLYAKLHQHLPRSTRVDAKQIFNIYTVSGEQSIEVPLIDHP